MVGEGEGGREEVGVEIPPLFCAIRQVALLEPTTAIPGSRRQGGWGMQNNRNG